MGGATDDIRIEVVRLVEHDVLQRNIEDDLSAAKRRDARRSEVDVKVDIGLRVASCDGHRGFDRSEGGDSARERLREPAVVEETIDVVHGDPGNLVDTAPLRGRSESREVDAGHDIVAVCDGKGEKYELAGGM